MALPVITALRGRDDLKESVLHTAQELAHRASIYGVARVSLSYLAMKCHCCKQTIINHLKQLIALKIIRKTVIWIKGNYCEINTYNFLLSWDKRPAKGGSQNSVPNLPPQEREKNSSLREELENQRKAIRLGFVIPGNDRWKSVQVKIAYLEGLLVGKGGESG
jgi:hypothetical protein